MARDHNPGERERRGARRTSGAGLLFLLLLLLLLSMPWNGDAFDPGAYGDVLTAKRIPIFFSNQPWILAIGAAITILFIVINASRDRTPTRTGHSIDVPPVVREVEQFMEDARYVRAMEILAEETRSGAAHPMERAVAHLASQGIDRARAEVDLAKIITVLHAMQEHA